MSVSLRLAKRSGSTSIRHHPFISVGEGFGFFLKNLWEEFQPLRMKESRLNNTVKLNWRRAVDNEHNIFLHILLGNFLNIKKSSYFLKCEQPMSHLVSMCFCLLCLSSATNDHLGTHIIWSNSPGYLIMNESALLNIILQIFCIKAGDNQHSVALRWAKWSFSTGPDLHDIRK